jgi:hypothetical protein
MGNNFGASGDVEMQSDILRTALGMIYDTTSGGELRDYPTTWSEPFEFAPGGAAKLKQASR